MCLIPARVTSHAPTAPPCLPPAQRATTEPRQPWPRRRRPQGRGMPDQHRTRVAAAVARVSTAALRCSPAPSARPPPAPRKVARHAQPGGESPLPRPLHTESPQARITRRGRRNAAVTAPYLHNTVFVQPEDQGACPTLARHPSSTLRPTAEHGASLDSARAAAPRATAAQRASRRCMNRPLRACARHAVTRATTRPQLEPPIRRNC